MRFFTFLLICVFILGLFHSCKKETNWDIDLEIPIANSHLDFSHFFGDSIFKSDTANLLHIALKKEIINYTIDSLANLPDTTINLAYTIPFSIPLNPGTLIFSNSLTNDKEITFDIDHDVELNKAIIKSGYLKVEYLNTYSQPMKFNYKISSAKLWGEELSINQSVLGKSNLVKYYPLNGYEIDLTGLAGNRVNTIAHSYTISTDEKGQPDVLLAGEGLIIKISFLNLVPQYIQGYFGQQHLTFASDSTYLGFSKNFNAKNILLSQSSINIDITNELGVELSGSIKNIRSMQTSPLNIITLNSDHLLQSLNIDRALKVNSISGLIKPSLKKIDISSSNSNLNDFLQNLPNYLGYNMKGTINPLGNISGGNDFAYYGKGLKVVLNIDIPLAISSDYFTLVNYSKLDLTNLKELSNVNTCEITLSALNNYPFIADIQGYMLNNSSQVIDSLFVPGRNRIQAAQTDNNNSIVSGTKSSLSCLFDKDKIQHLSECKQIKFVTFFYPKQSSIPIKIQANGYLDLSVKAKINYNAISK